MYYPKTTIVTPNFNGGAYSEKTIKSVLSQNYPNLEYIIIDGASADNSVDIIKKYEPVVILVESLEMESIKEFQNSEIHSFFNF
jgi:glycosyltransferase involved in cell wall biosynthesis